MFFVKKKTLQESLSGQMDLNRESEEGLILDKEKMQENSTNFLVSPTTHLFLLSGQLGSRGVGSIVTLNLKILKACNEDSKYTMLQNTTKLKRR